MRNYTKNQHGISGLLIVGAIAAIAFIAIVAYTLTSSTSDSTSATPTASANPQDPAVVQQEIQQREKVFRDAQGCQITDLAGCDEEGEWFQVPSQ